MKWFILLGLLVCLAVPTVVTAQDIDSSAARGVEQMALASGEIPETTISPVTALVTFVSTRSGFEIPLSAKATDSPESRALQFVDSFGEAFGLDSKDRVVVTAASGPDEVGLEHVRLHQVFEGIPVTGGELTVHLRGSVVVAVNAKTLPGFEGITTIPAIQDLQAEELVREALMKQRDLATAELKEPRLELFNRGLLEGVRYPTRLAWFVEATAPGVRDFFWIDARNGGVLLSFSQLHHARQREIFNAEDGSSLPGTHVRSEGEAATGDADADLAYDYTGDTYDYFLAQHGRDSFDDAGATLTSTVHFCPAPEECPYLNAYWDGSQMVFGDGFPAADDVVAHELTHAVTDFTANFFYYMQSGALDESYADIFGETMDQGNAAGDDTPDVKWLMGEDVPELGAARNMMDPNTHGDPGKMSDPLFTCADPGGDRGGVHSNSGVPNHAYALIVDGGSYNDLSIIGIGSVKAAKIQYRALTHYLLSASDFLDNANALQQSCTDLVGTDDISTADCAEVESSLLAVEMSDPWPCSPSQAEVPLLCPTGGLATDLFFDDLETIDSGQWSTGFGSGGNHWIGGVGDADLYTPVFATSGLYNFWGYNFSESGNSWVTMSFDLVVPAGAPRMQFAHSYGFHNSGTTYYDGGVLEYSTDGGSNWTDAGGLIVAGAAYGGTIFGSSGNPLAGRSAFTGDSYGYTATQLDLSDLEGQSVRFRFHIGTDNSVNDYGWFIDDIRFYTCPTLYDQTGSLDTTGYNSQQYASVDTAFDNRAADDFVVPPGEAPWNIDGVLASGFYGADAGPAPLLNVEFLSDDLSLPDSAVCTYTGLAAGTDFNDSVGDFIIRLPSTCSLPEGTYWVSVQADMDYDPLGQWYWTGQLVQSGSVFAWQNPGDGFEFGCTGWSTSGDCFTDPKPDLAFSLWSEDFIPLVCFALSVSHIGSGSDPKPLPINSPGCAAGEYVAGASITLNAAPTSGWEVVAWTGTDNNSSTSTTNMVTMPASAHAASVAYEVKSCYTLSLGHSGSGADPETDLPNSPGCSAGAYHSNEVLTLLAQPAQGQAIGAWSGTDDDANLSFINVVTMPAAHHVVTVSYVEIPAGCYQLYAGHSGLGTDPVPVPWNSPACPAGTYLAGETVLLEASADDGWTVGGWKGTDDDGSFLWVNSFDMPASDHVVSVQYVTPMLVKDIHPGSYGAFDRSNGTVVDYTIPVSIGPNLFFAGNDGVHGAELWKSDGTEAGTILVKDIRPGSGSAFPWSTANTWFTQTLVSMNGTLYFMAQDGVHDYELWKSDGTPDGTSMVKDIYDSWDKLPSGLTRVGDRLFFAHTNGTDGVELWKSDGTSEGTVMVKDIVDGAAGSSPQELAAFGSLLIFSATDPVNGREPWISDGTEEGTRMLRDIEPAAGSSPQNFTQVNDQVFFSANQFAIGRELWVSDGTTEGTTLVKDISPEGSGTNRGSTPYNLTNVAGTLFFTAEDTIGAQVNHGRELWRSDGTESGTMMVKDIRVGYNDSWPAYLTEIAGNLMFTADDWPYGGVSGDEELWFSDGSEEGTYRVKDIWPGLNPINLGPDRLMSIGGALMFTAEDPGHGKQLWFSDGTETGTFMLRDVLQGDYYSAPFWLTDVDGVLFFRASDGIHGREIWVLGDTSTCHFLTLQHSGMGANPVADPLQSVDCQPGFYEEGEVIALTANPDPDWTIGSWIGSDDDVSTLAVNAVTMPAVDHTVTVNYLAPDLIFASGFEKGDD